MKTRKIFLTAAAVFMMCGAVYANEVNVNLNGENVGFLYQQPVISQGRTLIPLRGVFDRLGYNILWNGETKTVTLYNSGGDNIVINIGDKFYTKNGERFGIDVPAQIIGGSTMLPLRAIGNVAGCDVSWDGETKTAYINKKAETVETVEDIITEVEAPSEFGVYFSGDAEGFNGITADIRWQPADYAQSYEFTALGKTTETPSNGVLLNNLNPDTVITVYVKSKAESGGKTYVSEQAEYTFKTPGATASRSEVSEDSQKITRSITWSSYKNNTSATDTYTINKDVYRYYSRLPRYYGANNYQKYMDEENNRKYLKKFADALRRMGDENDYTDDELVYEVIHFVQAIPYINDIDSRGEEEYPKYPIETFYEFNGDCEDVSILLAGVLRELGYGVCFIHVPGHVAVGVEGEEGLEGAYFEVDGVKYYYIEATGKGWNIGEYPENLPDTAQIIPIS